MASSIETLHALRDAGMPQEQAEIIARRFEESVAKEDLATKADLQLLRADLEILSQEIRKDNARLEVTLTNRMPVFGMSFAALVLGGVYFLLAHFKP